MIFKIKVFFVLEGGSCSLYFRLEEGKKVKDKRRMVFLLENYCFFRSFIGWIFVYKILVRIEFYVYLGF